jgi:hypothetical protein
MTGQGNVTLGNVTIGKQIYVFNNRCESAANWYQDQPLTKQRNYLQGAETFLRSECSFSYYRNSMYFMEPEGTLPHLQDPANGPDESRTHSPILYL